jgi:hypothetical protein
VFVSFTILGPQLLFFFIAIPVALISLALAFVRIQEMPLINYLAYALAYTLNPKKYLYQKEKESVLPIPTTRP